MLSEDHIEVGNFPDGLATADADAQLVFGQFGRGEGETDVAGFTWAQCAGIREVGARGRPVFGPGRSTKVYLCSPRTPSYDE